MDRKATREGEKIQKKTRRDKPAAEQVVEKGLKCVPRSGLLYAKEKGEGRGKTLFKSATLTS